MTSDTDKATQVTQHRPSMLRDVLEGRNTECAAPVVTFATQGSVEKVRLRSEVSFFEVGPNVYAVRTRDVLEGDVPLTGRHAAAAERLAQPRFGLTDDEGLRAVHENNVDVCSLRTDLVVQLDGDVEVTMAQHSPNAWDALLQGRARVFQNIHHANGTLLLDVNTDRTVPARMLCAHLWDLLLTVPRNELQAAIRAVTSLPGMQVITYYRDMNQEARNMVLCHAISVAESDILLFWMPEQTNWDPVIERVLETNNEQDSSFLARDGRWYPTNLEEATQEALLALNPDVATMLKRSAAPVMGR